MNQTDQLWLPDEDWIRCFEFLDAPSLFQCSSVSFQFSACATEESLWKNLCLKKWTLWDQAQVECWRLCWLRRNYYDNSLLPTLTHLSKSGSKLDSPLVVQLAQHGILVQEKLASIYSQPKPGQYTFIIQLWARLISCKASLTFSLTRWPRLLCEQDQENPHVLEQGAALIASMWFPFRNDSLESFVSDTLDAFAVEATTYFEPTFTTHQKFDAFNSFFKQKFRGNEQDYYHEDNSLINVVLTKRTGNPILLCLVYKSIAQRLNLKVQMVGLPGHFVVQVILDGKTNPFVDVYKACQVHTRAEILFLVGLANEGHLSPASSVEIWIRILRNRIMAESTDLPAVIFRIFLVDMFCFLLTSMDTPEVRPELEFWQHQRLQCVQAFLAATSK